MLSVVSCAPVPDSHGPLGILLFGMQLFVLFCSNRLASIDHW